MKEIIENYQILKSITNKLEKRKKNILRKIAGIIVELIVMVVCLSIFMLLFASLFTLGATLIEWANYTFFIDKDFLNGNKLLHSIISTFFLSGILYFILNVKNNEKKVIKEIKILNYISDRQKDIFRINDKEFSKIKKELTEEELLFLNKVENINYNKKLSENILNYIAKNTLNEKEKKNLNEIIKDFELNKEEIDFLQFKQNKKEIKKTNIVSL